MSRITALAAIALAALTTSCATLPPPEGRINTTALTDTADTRLGRAVAAGVADNPGKSGIHPLSQGTRRICGARSSGSARGKVARCSVLHLAWGPRRSSTLRRRC